MGGQFIIKVVRLSLIDGAIVQLACEEFAGSCPSSFE